MDGDRAGISLRLNGKVMQDSDTSDLIFSCDRLVSYCSQFATLRPGTVILTGTPSGVGYARQPPDVTIAGLGTLRNPVTAEQAP